MKQKKINNQVVFEYQNRDSLRIAYKNNDVWRIVLRQGHFVDILKELHTLCGLDSMALKKMGVCIATSSFSAARISVVVANLCAALCSTKLAFFEPSFFSASNEEKDRLWQKAHWCMLLTVFYSRPPNITTPS